IEAHNNAITGLILIDDHVAITGSFDYTVKRWNLETGELLETLTNGDSTAGLLLSPTRDSVYILRSLIIRESPISDLSDEQDRFSREWYPADVQPENVSEIGTITTAALAQDAPVMLTGYGSGMLAMWELETALPVTSVQGSSYVEMAIHPDGTLMALSTTFGTLEIWDIDPDSPTYLTVLHNVENDLAAPGLVDYNADGSQIVWGVADYFDTEESALYVIDSDIGEIVQTFDTSHHITTVRAVRFMANQNQIVSGSQDAGFVNGGDLIIWNIESGEPVRQFSGEAILDDVTDIAVIDDSHLLLSGAYFERVRLFNTVTGNVEQTFDAAHSSFGVQYLPQSRRVFTGTSNGIAIVWDVQTAETHARIEVQNGWMYDSDISPDERYAVVASDAQSPALINLETGTTVQIYAGYSADNVWGVAFSPDGQSVWTADMAGTIYQWAIEDKQLSAVELINWITENRYIHQPTCDVRKTYNIQPLCDE
ncbi:MAG: hypothetical protein KC708_25925, partial [Anaerolineae bacterium]|nr:hypothetical protein [Anaerolineae bacterium]